MKKIVIAMVLLAVAVTACKKKKDPEPTPHAKLLGFSGYSLTDTIYITVNGQPGIHSYNHGSGYLLHEGDQLVIDYKPKNDTNGLSIYIDQVTVRAYNCINCVARLDTVIGK